jgi:hypothetical protein
MTNFPFLDSTVSLVGLEQNSRSTLALETAARGSCPKHRMADLGALQVHHRSA